MKKMPVTSLGVPGSVEVDLTDLIAANGVDLAVRGGNSRRGSATTHQFVCNRVVDPDSVTLWIRIRIGNTDPDLGTRKLRNFSGKMHFLVIYFFNLPLKKV
jgi:hypothetical protein